MQFNYDIFKVKYIKTILSIFFPWVFSCAGNNPLFEQYPALQNHIPYISLGTFPTPLKKLNQLSQHLKTSLYIKQDNISGKQRDDGTRFFGGDKVRKLEFLLADACTQHAKSIITFGCVGSNHAVATACYANMLGLKTITLLKHQPNSRIVQRNLLLMDYYGADLYLCPNNEFRSLLANALYAERAHNHGDSAYVIPTGGSVPLGILGFVNAVFELKQQMQQRLIPEPDYIYVAAGSLGTTVGLLLGIKATRLKTKLIPVGVEPISDIASCLETSAQLMLSIKATTLKTKFIPMNAKSMDLAFVKKTIISLFQETQKLLSQADPSWPNLTISEDDINIIENFSGDTYGLFTQEAHDAMKLLLQMENIKLDGTYTAKTFAALLHDIATKNYSDKTILFWDTFCDDPCDDILAQHDYKQLPVDFHSYFQTSVQELDS